MTSPLPREAHSIRHVETVAPQPEGRSRIAIAVIIPCRNEAASIGKVVEDFRAVLPHAAIHVCDNDSSDDSAAIAADARAIVHHERLRGKGNVVRRLFCSCLASRPPFSRRA